MPCTRICMLYFNGCQKERRVFDSKQVDIEDVTRYSQLIIMLYLNVNPFKFILDLICTKPRCDLLQDKVLYISTLKPF